MITKLFTFVVLIVVVAAGLNCRSADKSEGPEILLDQDELKRPLVPCKEIDGRYLKAFIEAHKVFLNDDINPPDLRRIENYTISFREQGNKLLVDYLVKTPAEEKMKIRVGGGSSLGASCTYIFNKDTYQLTDKICPK